MCNDNNFKQPCNNSNHNNNTNIKKYNQCKYKYKSEKCASIRFEFSLPRTWSRPLSCEWVSTKGECPATAQCVATVCFTLVATTTKSGLKRAYYCWVVFVCQLEISFIIINFIIINRHLHCALSFALLFHLHSPQSLPLPLSLFLPLLRHHFLRLLFQLIRCIF